MEKKTIGFAIGHVTAIVLWVCCLTLIACGQNMVDNPPNADGGIYGFFGTIIIALGYMCAVIVTILWGIGTAIQLFGIIPVAIGVAVLFAVGITHIMLKQKDNPLYADFVAVEVKVLKGSVYSDVIGEIPAPHTAKLPSKNGDLEIDLPAMVTLKIIELVAEASVNIIGPTKYKQNGYRWFKVNYLNAKREPVSGYMSGAGLCATGTWINGLYNACATRDSLPESLETLAKINLQVPPRLESFTHRKTQANPTEIIRFAYKKLPGIWRSKYGSPFHLGEKREIYAKDENEIAGYWWLTIDTWKQKHALYLHFEYLPSDHLRSKRVRISYLNDSTLSVRDLLDNFTYRRINHSN